MSHPRDVDSVTGGENREVPTVTRIKVTDIEQTSFKAVQQTEEPLLVKSKKNGSPTGNRTQVSRAYHMTSGNLNSVNEMLQITYLRRLTHDH